MDHLKRVVVRIAQGALIALYGLCRLLPTQQRVVCLSRQSNQVPLDFVLLKEQISRDYPDWGVVVLARAMGNKAAYLLHMVRQVYYIATSRAAVLDSYCIVVSMLGRRLRIPVLQMWHALGLMKRAGYAALSDAEGRSAETAQLFHMHEGYTSVLVSAAAFVDDFAVTFNVDPSIVYEAPLPRVDCLVSEEVRRRKRAELVAAFPVLAEGKTVVYCPTFRTSYGPSDRAAAEALVDACVEAGLNVAYKPHPVSTMRLADKRVVTDESGCYDLLYAADYVVTDYSTIMYEAGLMGVPVFLYAYDWDDYRSRRSFELDLETDVPALFTADARVIVRAIEEKDFSTEAFTAFVQSCIAVPEGETCTERVERHLFRLIEGNETERGGHER